MLGKEEYDAVGLGIAMGSRRRTGVGRAANGGFDSRTDFTVLNTLIAILVKRGKILPEFLVVA